MRKRGLTLTEVMITILILGFLSLVSMNMLRHMIKADRIFDQHDAHYRGAQVVLERLRKQLEVAFLTPNLTAVDTYQTIFVGKDDGDTDQLWFTTMSHKRKYYGAREGDQAEVTLWVEDGPEDKGNVLMIRQMGRIDNEPDRGGTVSPLVENVVQFNLRYLDSETNEWRDDWDSTGVETANKLPRVVEIALQIEIEDPDFPSEKRSKTFMKTVILELATPLKTDPTMTVGGGIGGGL